MLCIGPVGGIRIFPACRKEEGGSTFFSGKIVKSLNESIKCPAGGNWIRTGLYIAYRSSKQDDDDDDNNDDDSVFSAIASAISVAVELNDLIVAGATTAVGRRKRNGRVCG